ncbi:phage tail protein [Escherichia coli]|nr:phage tail protein [Escherichia coli]
MIYTTGTIAVSGNTVTGKGTEFNAALSLIRVGCTLIAISDPVQIFSITEVKSATSLSVTPAASPAIPAGTKFSILLSDSISVDGLAQDVAETLRYYQGKESEIADAVEFFSDNKDVISASKLASESATTATNAATTATTAANSAKTYRDEAHEYANQTAKPYAYVLQPLPDVWIPFNDSLDMITGYGPGTKKVTIDGEEKTISSDKVVSFSRASTATYINKSGVLTVADTDEPRFERDGLLIEGTRTNYLTNSNTPTSWNANTGVLELTESGTDSYGFNYGTFTCTADAASTATLISTGTSRVIATASGESVTISGRFKGTGVRARARISKLNEDGSGNTFIADALLDLDTKVLTYGTDYLSAYFVDEGNGWLFFSTTYTATEDIDVYARFELSPKTGETLAIGDSITMTTPQYEAGSCASSFIVSGDNPTTRVSDMVTLKAKNNLLGSPFSILIELHREWDSAPNTYPRIFDAVDTISGRSIILAIDANTGKAYFGITKLSGSATNSYTSLAINKKTTVGSVVTTNNTGHSIANGQSGVEVTYNYLGLASSSIIRIGGGNATGDRHLFGHIRNFRIWHKALTDSQLSEIV